MSMQLQRYLDVLRRSKALFQPGTYGLSLIIIFALGLRLWGINNGLPYLYHPDEPALVGPAITTIQTGDWNPHFFHYPSLFHDMLVVLYAIYFIYGTSQGQFASVQDLVHPELAALGVGRIAFPSEILIGRLVSSAMSVLVVIIAYRIGRQLAGKRAGLLSALLLASSPTLTSLGHWTTVDMMGTAWVTLSLLFALRVARGSKWSDYLKGGVAAGLAAATKYPLAFVVVSLVTAHWVSLPLRQWASKKLLVGLVLVPLVFVMFTPYALLSLPEFLNGFGFSVAHYSRLGHSGMEGHALQWYLTYMLRQEGLWPFLVLPALLWAIRVKDKGMFVLGVYSILYFILISRQLVRNDRTLLPIIPALLIIAAVFTVRLCDVLCRSVVQKHCSGVVLLSSLTVGFLLITPLSNSVRYDLLLTQKDSRAKAQEWIEQNIPSDSKIALENYSPFLDSQRYSVTYLDLLGDHGPNWYRREGFDYIVFSSGIYERYYAEPERYKSQVDRYNRLFAEFPSIQEFGGGAWVNKVRISQVLP
jgi:4-amino-4-deoxy-L-arabinose transferase-like glycosyltransferase